MMCADEQQQMQRKRKSQGISLSMTRYSWTFLSRKLEVNALEIDREFIHELDALYLFLDEQLDIRKLQKRLTGKNRA